VTTVEQREKLRAAAQWMQGDDVLYVNDPARIMLLDEIEVLSKALRDALVLAEYAYRHIPKWIVSSAPERLAELRKLVQS
jgi:hypothetical protein